MKLILLLLFPLLIHSQGKINGNTHTINFKTKADYERKTGKPQREEETDSFRVIFKKRPPIDYAALANVKRNSKEGVSEKPKEILLKFQKSPTRPNFQLPGVNDQNSITPPDGQACVGSKYILNTTNQDFIIKDKAGDSITSLSFLAFFNTGIGGTGTFDPRCAFFKGRFIVSGDSEEMGVTLAVSDTDDPTGNWHIYHFSAAGIDTTLTDYPRLSFNDSIIVITTNLFINEYGKTTQPNYVYDQIFCFNLNKAFNGTLAKATVFYDSTISGLMFTKQVTPCDTLYGIADYLGAYNGSGYLYESYLYGTADNPKYHHNGIIYTNFTWNDFGLTGVPQLGSTNKLYPDDARILDAIYYNGQVTFTHTIFLPDTNPTYSACDVVQFLPANSNHALSCMRFSDASGLVNYLYPAIGINGLGDVAANMNVTSAAMYLSCAYAVKWHDSTTFSAPVIYQQGTSSYYKPKGGIYNRMGDYQGVCVDPVDNSFWVCGFWPSRTGYWSSQNYGTWNQAIVNVPLRNPTTFTATNITAITATLTVPANTANLIEYYYQVQGATAFTPSISPQLTGLVPATTYNVNCVEVYYSPFSIKPLNEISFTTLGH